MAKIDLSEVRAPFLRAILVSSVFSILFIGFGIGLFVKVTDPLLVKLQETVWSLEKALNEVKTLRGIVPICSFCKKIRDDKGYWNQVEVYIRERLDAKFSHGICPECIKEHYPDEYKHMTPKKKK